MLQNLDQTLRVIKATVHNHKDDIIPPYFFIVGAGISSPEVPLASRIIELCQEEVNKCDQEGYKRFFEFR